MLRLNIKHGLDLALGPAPVAETTLLPDRVALLGHDYPGLRPQLLVAEGDSVTKGQALFCDRRYPDVVYVAPCSGKIESITLSDHSSLEAVVIADCTDFTSSPAPVPPAAADASMGRDTLCATLQRHGLWPAFRTRPGDAVPPPTARPARLYVIALDSAPLAPDPASLINNAAEQFRTGLQVLTGLADRLFVCSRTRLPCPETENLSEVRVAGPHPAGLPGTLMHAISRASNSPWQLADSWYIGYQDVLAIGQFWLTGREDFTRCISVAGPSCEAPRRVTTVLGAALDSFFIEPAPPSKDQEKIRLISGTALSGRLTTPATRFLGRYDNQVVVLPEAHTNPDTRSAVDVGMHATETFDAVWPFKVPVIPLLRALLLQDSVEARTLGAQMLAAEDLALCSYLCPANKDYGAALEATLARIQAGD